MMRTLRRVRGSVDVIEDAMLEPTRLRIVFLIDVLAIIERRALHLADRRGARFGMACPT